MAEQNRVQKKKAEHAKKTKERAAVSENVKAAYTQLRDNPAMLDVVKKAREFSAYHMKMAKEAVGYEIQKTRHDDGTETSDTVLVHLSGEQRLAHLDKAAGLDEYLTYIDRQISPDV